MVVRTRNTEAASLAHHTREWEQRNNIQLGSHHPTQESKESMTPEREAEIRAWAAQKQHCEFYGSHWLMASDLIAAIDSLRKGYTSVQEKYLTTFDELENLEEKCEAMEEWLKGCPHRTSCAQYGYLNPDGSLQPCSCGLSKLLEDKP